MNTTPKQDLSYEEIQPKLYDGMTALILNTALIIAAIAFFIWGIVLVEQSQNYVGQSAVPGIAMIIVGGLYSFLIGPILYAGLKILRPNEALILTLFGQYYGTIKHEGFYFVHPFATGFNPAARYGAATTAVLEQSKGVTVNSLNTGSSSASAVSKKISLKVMTLNNDKQKINDQLGNPIIIGIVVVWKVVSPTKAVFNVDNYKEFLSIQCDSALRNIVRLYPYDTFGEDNERTLRASSQEVAVSLQEEIQAKVDLAGLEILEARITHLSYAPEIAASMLQRQQASAVIDARQMIVEGAVGMVEMALHKLSESNLVELDDERKAAMVSNLLVVLCGNKDAQPIVNSGSLY